MNCSPLQPRAQPLLLIEPREWKAIEQLLIKFDKEQLGLQGALACLTAARRRFRADLAKSIPHTRMLRRASQLFAGGHTSRIGPKPPRADLVPQGN